jgi:hypothetical protein
MHCHFGARFELMPGNAGDVKQNAMEVQDEEGVVRFSGVCHIGCRSDER